MASLNKVILVGCLTDDPVVRDIKEDRKVVGTMVGLAIETVRSWFDQKSGEMKQGVELHRIVVTQNQLATFAKTLSKGDEVYLEGELLTHFWRNELQEWQTLTQILLWQTNNQLCRFANDTEESHSIPSSHQVLNAFDEARMQKYANQGKILMEAFSHNDRKMMQSIG